MTLSSELIGIAGIVILNLILIWPAVTGNSVLMSDSWRMHYPWAVEGEVDPASLSDDSSGIEYAPETEEPRLMAFDIYLECLPWYEFAGEELRSGRWPHWNPHSFCGAPLYANHLVPLTHPPLLIAMLTTRGANILTVTAFLTWLIGSAGLYFYLRTIRIEQTAALIIVSLYLTCGHYMPLVPFQMSGLMYFPWLMWASTSLNARPSGGNVLFFAVVLGMMLMAGHPGYVVPFLYFIGLHRILSWIFIRDLRHGLSTRIWVFIIAFIAGVLLSMMQNYPTLRLLQDSARDMSASTMTNGGDRALYGSTGSDETSHGTADNQDYVLQKTGMVFVPIFLKQIELQHPYTGIPLLLLALAGIILTRPPPQRKVFIILAVVFGLLSIPPIFQRLAWIMPGMGISPYTPYATSQFLIFLLAARGLNEIVSPSTSENDRTGFVFIALSVIGTILFAWIFLKFAILSPDTEWEKSQKASAFITLILGAGAIVLTGISYHLRGKATALAALVFPLILTINGYYAHFYQYPVFQDRTPVMTPSLEVIPQDSNYRVIRHTSKSVTHHPGIDNPLTFGGNLAMWAGYNDSQGYDSFVLRNQWKFLRAIEPTMIAWNGLSFPVTDSNRLSTSHIDAMAVRYVISDDPNLLDDPRSGLDPEKWQLLHNGGLVIYEKPYAIPRWYLSESILYVTDFQDALDTLEVRSLHGTGLIRDYGPSVCIEDPTEVMLTEMHDRNPDPPGEIELIDETPQHLEFSVDVDRDCWFVLSDTWHSEWRAYVDGSPVEISHANGAYRAIELTGGSYKIEFTYEPNAFRTGLLVTSVTLILLILGTIFGYRKPSDQYQPATSGS